MNICFDCTALAYTYRWLTYLVSNDPIEWVSYMMQDVGVGLGGEGMQILNAVFLEHIVDRLPDHCEAERLAIFFIEQKYLTRGRVIGPYETLITSSSDRAGLQNERTCRCLGRPTPLTANAVVTGAGAVVEDAGTTSEAEYAVAPTEGEQTPRAQALQCQVQVQKRQSQLRLQKWCEDATSACILITTPRFS